MDEAKADLVRSWLSKAQHDLASAKKLSSDPDPYLDTAIYHCQQTAEKAMQGFLVLHDQEFGKTHDIENLIELAETYETRFSMWIAAANQLTPYAVIYRYPEIMAEPDQDEFDKALAAAEGIYNFIMSLLPEEVRPHDESNSR